jgi:CRISPR/Cas system CSM-associated protein Csm5 (group 7 of RAMP superfamily)
MRRKFQTTVRPNGKTPVVTQLGWVSDDRIEADMQQEREHFARLAMRNDLTSQIQSIEEATDTLTIIHESGKVIVVHWVADLP